MNNKFKVFRSTGYSKREMGDTAGGVANNYLGNPINFSNKHFSQLLLWEGGSVHQ
jgi:hypothetical protein